MHTYHAWGIRRCGSHAIIGWILHNIGSPYVHFNDIQDPHDPLTPGGVNVSGVPMWRYKRGLLRKIRYRYLARDRSSFAGADASLDYEGLAAIRNLSCRVFSYEDKFFAAADDTCGGGVAGDVCKSILVLRDPFNLCASLLRSGYFSRGLDELPALYCNHAEAFLRGDRAHVVGLNYNQWVRDRAYRISAARRLGFETDGSPYDSIPANGGGSSFSGQSYSGKASQMNLFGRWHPMVASEEFCRLVCAPQVHEVAMTIFPALASEVYDAIPRRFSQRRGSSARHHAKGS